ncbi:MAG: protein-ADP-ribose hydrolase [Clostridiales bacterium]|nr:protein-ADP-ribose hydrolase [Clostridiales bacterium]
MTQSERRKYLINALLEEQPRYRGMEIPDNEEEQKLLLRALFNIRYPGSVSEEFIEVQDAYLKEENASRGITNIEELRNIADIMGEPCEEWLGDVYLWQGDITTLKCGAIVNAANSQMLGCFVPNHRCIDNAIHTFSGIQLRNECFEIMQNQGHEEPTGCAKITKAYNLPSEYVIHTVGPIIRGLLTQHDEDLLASCYNSCLVLADENNIDSIAFCCISTGEFHFPNRRAAEIAIETVKNYKNNFNSKVKVIFNVFLDNDCNIYRELLGIN